MRLASIVSVAVLAVACSVSACGGGGEGDGASPSATVATERPTSSAELSIASPRNGERVTGDSVRLEIDLAEGALSVRDHGPGFEAGDLPHVFDRFYRAPGARALPGSGLGLAIVRQTAESHGGDAQASNAPGGGALLRVTFGPVVRTPARASAAAARSTG